ncbi:P27 family phage terminase small subunit [Lacticaseibacillus pantheris]|uniref:P27 family phage terminase small subunit n=1 Tax=Lacticaseibacillus pantheris TaxID=171523 RepID=UPI00265A6A34|nr:P27 family phage terminase small subunit [Lacticaseibacillus pantheris]WKF84479.1 P27 family phage terminase small subunit [Lacticaseibacillus pantheris]
MSQLAEVEPLDMRRRVVQQMKGLGTYKEEYDDMINIYADLLDQYAVLQNQFAAGGYQVSEEYTNKAGATNQRKVPVLNALETLRKDIVSYSDRLMLNPKTNMAAVSPPGAGENPLEAFMKEHDRG